MHSLSGCRLGSLTASALVALLLVSGCKDEQSLRLLNEANDKVVACKREVNDLKNQVASLKQQLAQALANPGKITLTDPEIINLIASIKGPGGGGGSTKPSLDPQEASKVVFQGARAMQACYERALKKNQALQYQAGVGLTLDINVRSAGSVEGVQVAPNVDREMTECIKTAAMRWKFPAFQGENVVISQKVTLTPKS